MASWISQLCWTYQTSLKWWYRGTSALTELGVLGLSVFCISGLQFFPIVSWKKIWKGANPFSSEISSLQNIFWCISNSSGPSQLVSALNQICQPLWIKTRDGSRHQQICITQSVTDTGAEYVFEAVTPAWLEEELGVLQNQVLCSWC